MAIIIKKAQKYGAKLRLAIYGPSGSGKTYTALTYAQEMAGDKRICVIDTERGSASKYADLFDFDVIELDSFHPTSYIEAIKAVVQSKEYGVLVIDSTSHEWEGSKGALELAGRDFTNWANVTPVHNRFVDAMLAADIHVIATMRAKEEHVMEQKEVNGKTKNVVTKKGMEPIQRKGMVYEFDIVAALDMDNALTIEKTRCSGLKDQSFLPGSEKSTAALIKAWLDGAPAPVQAISKERLNALYGFGKNIIGYADVDGFTDAVKTALGSDIPIDVKTLTEPQARDFEDYVRMRDLQAASERKTA